MIAQANQLPPPLQQQIEIIRRLEEIFQPFATNRRNALFAPDMPWIRFVHYTSAESALKIITSKRLWMRNTTCMADYREVQHGHEILVRYFSDTQRRNSFVQSLEQCSPGSAIEAMALFDQWLSDIRAYTYIASVSEHSNQEDQHGRLSMWRAFGDTNVARVALVIKVPHYSEGQAALNVIFSPVAYLDERGVHVALATIIQNICNNANFLATISRTQLVANIFNMFVAIVTCVKHLGFHEEREWRVMYSPNRNPSALIDASIETVRGVPQVVYRLPLDVTRSNALADLDLYRMVDRLIIGPTSYPWVLYDAFVKALAAAGVTDAHARVITSAIPIRS
jgi:hypothetical protein